MESPNKRLKPSPPEMETEQDFIPLRGDDDFDTTNQYGYGPSNDPSQQEDQSISSAPRAPRAMYNHTSSNQHGYGYQAHNHVRNDPRHAKDKPKSKHILLGYEPWILIKTKYGRRFVHNTETGESLWRIPRDVLPGIHEFERWELEQKEKEANAKWAEVQLAEMRPKQPKTEGGRSESTAGGEMRARRRRSESLQREDEEAMMAMLAAEAEKDEEEDVKEAVQNVDDLKPIGQPPRQDGAGGYESDSSYEVIEVTDSEFEGDDEQEEKQVKEEAVDTTQQQDDGPVEFGEDDIAYQLAAMEEDYDDEGDDYYADEAGEPWDQDPEAANGEAPTEDQQEDSVVIFREMLDDHHISPFTPWDKLIEDESDSGIIMDHRYTALPNMRSRREVWEAWVKDTAARLKEERARMEQQDPRIPYLAFLADKAMKATLYWPEFKRKWKREAVMNDRKLIEKDREKLYRDHMNRLKLPESTRKADLITVLKSIPLRELNGSSSLDSLPQQLLSHLHYISLPASTRDPVIKKHIAGLSQLDALEDGEDDGEDTKKRLIERQKRDAALAERQRKVDEQKRQAAKEERWARKGLLEEERELKRAMDVGSAGLKANLTAE